MIIASSPHCHTSLVDGKSTAKEMVLAAIRAGFVSVGFSEHGQQRVDPAYGLADCDLLPYKETVLALGEQYEGQIRVHLGVERDFYSHADRADFSYVIGACHYFLYDDTFCAVDGPYESLLAYRDEIRLGDGAAMVADYYRMLGDYALSYRPDIIAHFDLIKKQNRSGRLYDPDDPKIVNAAHDALDKILASGALLEVNTGGMARGYLDVPYPDLRYLKYWQARGGRVIVGSDCHFAPHIAFGFDMVPAYLAEAGIITAWRLGAHDEDQFVEYPLAL